MKTNLKLLFFLLIFLTNFSLWSDVVIQSSYNIDSQFSDRYILNISIQNNSNKVLKGWKTTFTLAATQKIDNLWNGQYVVSDLNVSVRNEGWNGTLQPGQEVHIGIEISGSGAPGISNLKTLGDDGSRIVILDPDPVDPLLITLTPNVQVLSNWGGGSQVLLKLHNISDTDVNRWIVEFDLAPNTSITSLCGGEFVVTNNHVKITSPLWPSGGDIPAGSKIELSIILKSETLSNSPFSNIVASGNPNSNVEVPLAPILNPISNDDKDGNYTISWNAVSGALRYTLQESTSNNFSNPINVLTENVLQKVVQGHQEGTYYYRVFVIGQNANGPYSNIQSVTVQSSPASLGTPLLNEISNADLDSNYLVSWSAVENATSYVLEESRDVSFTSFITVYAGSDTRKEFGSKANGTYYYRVKAKNFSETGNVSNVVEVIVNINNPNTGQRKIIGYFPNWAIYRARPFYAKDINPNLITHINYAFASVDTDGTIHLFNPWSDTDFNAGNTGDKPYSGNFYQLYQLKKQKPGLKTLISIGGWTLSNTFSQMTSTATTREKFAQNCVNFCKKYDFDGVDIDWEYPGYAHHNGRPKDTSNFTLLLEAVSKKFKAQNPILLLTIAAPADHKHYKDIEVAKIHQYLDWINIMGYDFHGPWGGREDAVTNHLAPIKQTEVGDPQLNIKSVLNYYISQNVPKEKILLGLPLYGRSFAGVDDTPTGLYSTYAGPGYATAEEVGYVFFSDIQKNLIKTYKTYWDPMALGAYIYNPTTKDIISYDNEQSWTLKSQIIKDLGLGGAMVWELGMDTMPDWKMMTLLNNQLKN